MTSTFFANTNSKIRKLKEDKSYPVLENSGLSVIKRGKSRYLLYYWGFIWSFFFYFR